MKTRLLEMIELFAVTRQGVKLSSGKTSDIYLDCRQIYFRGEGQFVIGELFFEQMLALESEHRFDACGGMALGAAPLSCALSMAAFRRGRELPGVVVRKEPKEHGLCASIEGDRALFKGCRLLLLEDVVTTGQSAIMAIKRLRERGAIIDSLLCLVDREEGGAFNLGKEGISLKSLFTLKDFLGEKPSIQVSTEV